MKGRAATYDDVVEQSGTVRAEAEVAADHRVDAVALGRHVGRGRRRWQGTDVARQGTGVGALRVQQVGAVLGGRRRRRRQEPLVTQQHPRSRIITLGEEVVEAVHELTSRTPNEGSMGRSATLVILLTSVTVGLAAHVAAEMMPSEDIFANSRKIAEELSKATTANAKKNLKQLAENMDVNKDGSVDHEELTRWLMKSFRVLSKEESEERFEEADTDHDGIVTWEEYLVDMYGENSQMDGDQEMIREDKEIFEASDANRDGKLDKTEYLSFTHPEEHQHTMEILYRRTMNEKDLNGDGFLDFAEFIGNEGKDRDEEWRVAEKDRFDNDFDSDRDGTMGREEILHWLSPNNKVSAMEEADHLIQSADDNGDKVLSIQEIIKHHDVFTGSEITDFGHHLENVNKFIRDEL